MTDELIDEVALEIASGELIGWPDGIAKEKARNIIEAYQSAKQKQPEVGDVVFCEHNIRPKSACHKCFVNSKLQSGGGV